MIGRKVIPTRDYEYYSAKLQGRMIERIQHVLIDQTPDSDVNLKIITNSSITSPQSPPVVSKKRKRKDLLNPTPSSPSLSINRKPRKSKIKRIKNNKDHSITANSTMDSLQPSNYELPQGTCCNTLSLPTIIQMKNNPLSIVL
jgi:hypothetical protein